MMPLMPRERGIKRSRGFTFASRLQSVGELRCLRHRKVYALGIATARHGDLYRLPCTRLIIPDFASNRPVNLNCDSVHFALLLVVGATRTGERCDPFPAGRYDTASNKMRR